MMDQVAREQEIGRELAASDHAYRAGRRSRRNRVALGSRFPGRGSTLDKALWLLSEGEAAMDQGAIGEAVRLLCGLWEKHCLVWGGERPKALGIYDDHILLLKRLLPHCDYGQRQLVQVRLAYTSEDWAGYAEAQKEAEMGPQGSLL